MLKKIVQRYVPVSEHDGSMPLMLSRPKRLCAVTCENLAWFQPSLPTPVLLKLTLPRRPTTISGPSFIDVHLPVSCLGTTVVVADAATPLTLAASTSKPRTSAARRSRSLLFITVPPSTM